jgi:hypothetical protein
MRFTSAFCPGERVLSNPDSGSEITLGLPAVREKSSKKAGLGATIPSCQKLNDRIRRRFDGSAGEF